MTSAKEALTVSMSRGCTGSERLSDQTPFSRVGSLCVSTAAPGQTFVARSVPSGRPCPASPQSR